MTEIIYANDKFLNKTWYKGIIHEESIFSTDNITIQESSIDYKKYIQDVIKESFYERILKPHKIYLIQDAIYQIKKLNNANTKHIEELLEEFLELNNYKNRTKHIGEAKYSPKYEKELNNEYDTYFKQGIL